MADNDDLGLTQEDIDAALGEAGRAAAAPSEAKPSDEPPDSPASQETGGPVSQEDIDAALAQAETAASQLAGEPAPETPADPEPAPQADVAPPPSASAAMPMEIPSFDAEDVDPAIAGRIELLNDVKLHVKIELGRSRMLVEDVLKLSDGSVVELDKLAGDPVDVYVNERLVARGEVLVLSDNFCVRISEIVSQQVEEEEEVSA